MSVFANGLEVSGKATPNKTIAAMPDVCMSPPPPPAGPVPIPYPNFGMASDTTDGCTSVFVKGKEAGKKNGSKYSKITGDEPATNSFGAGVVSHKISGHLEFAAYSFDVILEGGGAERFTDLTTTNHSNPTNGGLSISVATLDVALINVNDPCEALKAANKADFKAVEAFANDPKTDITDKQRASLKRFNGSGTISHAVITGSGPASVVGGTSSGLVRRFSDGLAGPADSTDDDLIEGDDGKKKIPSAICAGQEPYEHPRGGFHAHSEPCILDSIGPVTPRAKMIMAIEWHQAGNPKPRADACKNCEKVLAHACQCMDIELCNGDGTGTRSACPPKPEASPV